MAAATCCDYWRTTRVAQQAAAEFCGTLLLCLAVVLSSVTGSPTYQAVAFTVVGLTYAFESQSCHFNPAVTFAALLNGSISPALAGLFIAAQTAGGCIGGVVGNALRYSPVPSYNPPDIVKAFLVEAIFTGALVLVWQNVLLHKHAREPNSFYGVAIGFVIAGGASAVSAISGGCFNPAIGMAIDFATLSSDPHTFADIWIYWGAPFLGAALATLFQALMNRWQLIRVAFPGWLCRCACFCGVCRSDPAADADAGSLPLLVLAVEFVGTFYLVLTAALSQAPFAIGAMLTALIYSLDHISGDFNPAVTLGVAIRRGLLVTDRGKVIAIMLAQTLGAFGAAFIAFFVAGQVNYPSPTGAREYAGAVFFEAIWTALLVYTVCAMVAPAAKASAVVAAPGGDAVAAVAATSASHHGLAIGFVLTAGIFCATGEGAGSGGVFNPALGVATVVVNWWCLGRDVVPAWIYVAGPFGGAVLGAFLFIVFHIQEGGSGDTSSNSDTSSSGAAKAKSSMFEGSSMFADSPYSTYGGTSFGTGYSTL